MNDDVDTEAGPARHKRATDYSPYGLLLTDTGSRNDLLIHTPRTRA